jgi:hypothetical protein
MEYVLDGLEAELEIERELGVRVVQIDRLLLVPPQASSPLRGGVEKPAAAEPAAAVRAAVPPPSSDVRQPATGSERQYANGTQPTTSHEPRSMGYDFVFLHDRQLSQGGVEMMAKIVTAMKKTADAAPIVFNGERPAAKAYVLLGSGALRKWLPGVKGAPGEWVKDQAGNSYLVTYSPEFILRMGPPTPAVKEIKMKMWTSLKGVMQRVVSG